MSENKKTVSLAMAIVTLLVVAGIMSVGLAILKLNTMVTFILTFLAVCIIAVCVGSKLNELEDMIMAATNEALHKMEEESSAAMAQLTGGLGNLGGLPF